ncbi:TPA: LacI family DNA-binding transcriptional regulator [Raoultella planticola]|nr:LacI family DNA-binding transcriptional regulator [Klebsiella pneumoniae]
MADKSGSRTSLTSQKNSRTRGKASSGVTLEDVALKAGVSTASVSRLMKDTNAVSAKLRLKIETAINELGWMPHAAARALATNRTRTIGAIFPTLANEHFSTATQVLQEQLERYDYTLLLACSEYDLKRELRQVRKMLERGVDAMVLVGDRHEQELYPLLRTRAVPFVSTFTWRAGNDPLCIGADNQRAFYDATRYLISLGHTRFGMLAQRAEHNDRALARRTGVRLALEEESLAIRPSHFVEGYWGVEEGRKLFHKLINVSPRPTAVICGNGTFAMGALLEALSMGIKVPEELTIFGFDDFELMKELPVAISTIRIPSEEIGCKATHYLMEALGEENQAINWNTEAECRAELILRDSSGKPYVG